MLGNLYLTNTDLGVGVGPQKTIPGTPNPCSICWLTKHFEKWSYSKFWLDSKNKPVIKLKPLLKNNPWTNLDLVIN